MAIVYYNISSGCGTTRLHLKLDKESKTFTGTYYSYWMGYANPIGLDLDGPASTPAPGVWKLQLSKEKDCMFLYTLGSDIPFVFGDKEHAHMVMSWNGSVNHDNTTYNAILTTDSINTMTEDMKHLKDQSVFKCVFTQE